MTQLLEDVEAAQAVAREANQFREATRWRVASNDPDRQAHIEALLGQIDDVMRPLRSHIGRLVWEPIPAAQEDELRRTSAALQYERRQIKKMRR